MDWGIRMAKSKTYRSMSGANVENMTVSQLKGYIREVAGKVGMGLRSSNKAISSAARNIVATFGTYRRKGTTYLRMGISKARKQELIQKAQKLRSFATTVSERRNSRSLNPRAEKAYQKFMEHEEYAGTSRAEWEDLMEIIGELQSMFEEFGSTFINMYYEYRFKGLKAKTILEVAKETREEVLKEGKEQGRTVTKREVVDRIAEKLKTMFS